MNIKKIVTGLLTAMALLWAPVVYAQDNGTEFGIEDDLTVLGRAGTALDPDVEIKGFTVFGSTQSSYLIPVNTGNVVMNGIVQVSSGLYVAGSSTFAAGAYFLDISSFSDVAKVHFGGGGAGQILKKIPGGGMVWGNDDTGGFTSGAQNWIPMYSGTGLAASRLLQDPANNGVTLMTSSMTIQGIGGFGLGVAGATSLSGALTVVGANATTLGGTLGVTGASSLSTLGTSGLATLNSASITTTLAVTGAATLSSTLAVTDNVAHSSNTVMGGAIGAIDDNARLKVVGGTAAGNYAATFYSGASLAAWIKKK